MLFLLLATSSPAEAGMKERMQKDRVAVAEGKMKIEDFYVCKVNVPGSKKATIQYRAYAEVPTNAGISRDYFVSFEAMSRVLLITRAGAAMAKGTTVDPLKALDCDGIDAPIGKVDLDISLYLTGDGFQLAVTDGATGKVTQEAKLWADIGK